MDITTLTPAQLSHAAFCGQITYAQWDAEEARRADFRAEAKTVKPTFGRTRSTYEVPNAVILDWTALAQEILPSVARSFRMEPDISAVRVLAQSAMHRVGVLVNVRDLREDPKGCRKFFLRRVENLVRSPFVKRE